MEADLIAKGAMVWVSALARREGPVIHVSAEEIEKARAGKYKCRMVADGSVDMVEEGYFEKHLNRMRLYYKKQREAVLSVLKEDPFKCVGRVREADSGLHFIFELNTLLSDNEVKRKLEADGIHINALSEYYHNNTDEYSHSFVISYSDMKIENFKIACSKMSKLTPL
jgi:DNA-binding transcriptional MocR family regulator